MKTNYGLKLIVTFVILLKKWRETGQRGKVLTLKKKYLPKGMNLKVKPTSRTTAKFLELHISTLESLCVNGWLVNGRTGQTGKTFGHVSEHSDTLSSIVANVNCVAYEINDFQ